MLYEWIIFVSDIYGKKIIPKFLLGGFINAAFDLLSTSQIIPN